MLAIEYVAEARCDFDDSFDWYAERDPRTATRFLEAVGDALDLISSDPTRFAAVDQIHREIAVRRFPFRVIFRSEPDRIVVVAIAHAKRHPRYWKRRK